MTEWHTYQLDGTTCGKRNCAACSGAMGLYWQTAEQLTGSQFRTEAGVSCIPGVHSASGGLFISDVIRVFEEHGATIDYGQNDDPPLYRRNSPAEMPRKLQANFGGVILGDYDTLPVQYRASATFLGDHSAWVHGYRVSLGVEQTHWHDPLRHEGIWIPISAVISYWQKPGSPVRGYAGWVELLLLEESDDMDPRVDIPKAFASVASGGTVYANPQKSAVLVANWAGAGNVGVYSQRPAVGAVQPLTAIRIDLAGGTATDLRIGWIGTDKVTLLPSGITAPTVAAAQKTAAAAVKSAADVAASKYGA